MKQNLSTLMGDNKKKFFLKDTKWRNANHINVIHA